MSAKNEQIEFLLLNILSWGIEQKRNYEVSETLYFFFFEIIHKTIHKTEELLLRPLSPLFLQSKWNGN